MEQEQFYNLSVDSGVLRFDTTLDLAIANSIRRTISADVPTAAFAFRANEYNIVPAPPPSIVVHKNTTVLHDEIIAHRISLLPIHFSEAEVASIQDDVAHYEFFINLLNSGPTPLNVTSGDITGTLEGAPLDEETLRRLFPADPVTGDNVLIARMSPLHVDGHPGTWAEELVASMIPVIGVGRQHTRWSPVSVCAFGNVVDAKKADADLKELVDAARARGATADEIELLALDFNSLDRLRVTARGKDAPILHFTIRSECGLRPTYLVLAALRVLHTRLLDIAEQMIVRRDKAMNDVYAITINGENHTIGNLIQSVVHDTFGGREVMYIGYHQPHPLEDYIVVKVKLNDAIARPGQDKEFCSHAVKHVADVVAEVARKWLAAISSVFEDQHADIVKLAEFNKFMEPNQATV